MATKPAQSFKVSSVTGLSAESNSADALNERTVLDKDEYRDTKTWQHVQAVHSKCAQFQNTLLHQLLLCGSTTTSEAVLYPAEHSTAAAASNKTWLRLMVSYMLPICARSASPSK